MRIQGALGYLGVALLLISVSARGESVSAGSLQTNDELKQCGEAKLSVLFWDVYESALYTPTGRYEPTTRPLRLEIRYLRNIKSDDLVTQTRKEWQAQGLSHPNQPSWLEALGELWPDVRKDDVLALVIDESNQSLFTLNGEPLGSINDTAFGEQFAAIWLSPDTTRPALRAQLIGNE